MSIKTTVAPNHPLSAWDRVPFSDFPGQPTILVGSNPDETVRHHKYVFEALREANLNVSLTEGDYYLTVKPPTQLHDKVQLQEILSELGLPSLPTYSTQDLEQLRSISHPVILKPRQGKGGRDRGIFSAYKVFPDGNALVDAVTPEIPGYGEQLFKKRFFVERAIANQDQSVSKILGLALINGKSEVVIPFIGEEVWRPATRGHAMEQSIRRPTSAHDGPVLNIATKVANALHLKNCCLYIQAIVDNGVYYFNDADMRISVQYARVLRSYLVQHLRYMFDQVPIITIPHEYSVTRILTTLKGDVSSHLDLLESTAESYDAFYWVQRFDMEQESNSGRYMIIASGETETEALNKINIYTSFLTTE